VVAVKWRGYLYAEVEDRRTGEVIPVYHRLGRWRRYGTDETISDRALAACARRALRDADVNEAWRRAKAA